MYIYLFSSVMCQFTTTHCLSRENLGQLCRYQQYVMFLPMHQVWTCRTNDFDRVRLSHRFSAYPLLFFGRYLIIREAFTRFLNGELSIAKNSCEFAIQSSSAVHSAAR